MTAPDDDKTRTHVTLAGGTMVSHYRIVEKIGAGGMGEVYLAEDTELGRRVALKFLPLHLCQDGDCRARFKREAQAAAKLDHPNIVSVFEVSEFQGRPFFVMQHVEGQSLKEVMAGKTLPLDRIVELGIQICDGLQAAHESGITHRDIKPSNILIDSHGRARIVDFGLASVKGTDHLTKTGSTLGTIGYMSPEQVRSDPVDARSDLFSLGVVLYEAITSHAPFKADSEAATLNAITNNQPELLARFRREVSPELQSIMDKALEKNVSTRYQHADELSADLRRMSASKIQLAAPRRDPWNRYVVTTAVAVLLTIAGYWVVTSRLLTKPETPESTRKMLAVLPFENLGSPEDEYFANGTTDAITARLAGVSGLGVISRQSAMQYRKTTKSIRQIGKELGVDYILEGTVQREKPGDPTSRIRVIPQLIRVADDTHVWADHYDENMTEVFRVQSDIAERVAGQLNVALLEPERRAIEKQPTENLEAYEAYLRGLEYRTRLSMPDGRRAVEEFQRAVSLDPRFAEAWAWLSIAHRDIYWMFDRPASLPLAREAARRAEELGPDLPETQLAQGYLAYGVRDFQGACAHFENAERLRPSGEAARATGYSLRRMGKWEEALRRFESARPLLPHNYGFHFDDLGYTSLALRRFDEAEKEFDLAISLAPELSSAHLYKAHLCLARNGDLDGARKSLRELMRFANKADAAEEMVSGGAFEYETELRVLPEACLEVLNALDSGRLERMRPLQPAAIATLHLARAFITEAREGRPAAVAHYDSARVHFERIIESNQQSAYIAAYHGGLGLAYAGLGRKADAIREGEEAVQMMPLSKDAVVGEQVLGYLAQIYVMCGEHEKAIDQLETLLSVPGEYSAAILRVDPIWSPVRDNPRFRRLAEGR